jgi:pimeloyl-ACP methyl ester carboxylesterase
MVRVSTDLSELEVSVIGNGEPVLLIHGGFFGGSFGFGGIFDPLCKDPTLQDRHQVITYDRHGYGKSSKPDEPYSHHDVVADALETLRQTGADRAHVVAHSAGGPYGLQFAMDHPDVVHSLTLIESVLPIPEWGEFLATHFAPAGEALAAGDRQTAIERSFGAVYGSTNFRSDMDPLMPEGWYERALDDLGYLFKFESPALRQFTFGAEDARRIRQPVLLMRGEQTEPIWVIQHERLKEWIPHAREHVVPGANHAVQIWNPQDATRALTSFFEAHPIGGPVGSRA